MGTKNTPGAFAGYANAAPDEPMFVLLARDDRAPLLVSIWAHVSNNDFDGARIEFEKLDAFCRQRKRSHIEKVYEALDVADAMREWRRKDTPA